MAYFIRGTGSDLTPIQHSKSIFKNYLKQMSLKGLMGKKGSGKPIIVDDTLKAQAGDTIRYHFIPQDDTDGIEGQNASVSGNESSLDEYSMDLRVDQIGKAFRREGKMTKQRIIWDFRPEAKMQLENWFAQRSEDWLFQAMTGVRDGMSYAWTATTDLVSGTGRCIRADGSNGSAAVTAANSDNTALASAISGSDKMNCRLIEDAVIMARTAGTYKVRPIKVGPNGEEFFILFLSLQAARDLRFTADWLNHAYSVVERGIEKDPIAHGALGVWNNVILKPTERVLTFADSTETIARNLLVGADAAVLGWAQTMDYSEEAHEHGRWWRAYGDEIRGQKKLAFNSVDCGVVQVVTASN